MTKYTVKELIMAFNNQLGDPGIENETLIHWMNELIDIIVEDNGFGPVKSQDYVIVDVMTQDLPLDFKCLNSWYQGDVPYLGKVIRYRPDGKFIFPAGGTYTLIYSARVDSVSTEDIDADIPVKECFHPLFVDYLKGKFYKDSGEGDEETVYGNMLVNSVESKVITIGSKEFNLNQGPVKPMNTQKWTRHSRGMEVEDDE